MAVLAAQQAKADATINLNWALKKLIMVTVWAVCRELCLAKDAAAKLNHGPWRVARVAQSVEQGTGIPF
jgi:hypothetical protein